MSFAVVFSKTKVYADQPVEVVAGSTFDISCTAWGTITATPTVATYRNRVSVSIAAGPHTYSGKTATLVGFTGLTGNARYLVDVTLTVAGDALTKKILIKVVKAEVE